MVAKVIWKLKYLKRFACCQPATARFKNNRGYNCTTLDLEALMNIYINQLCFNSKGSVCYKNPLYLFLPIQAYLKMDNSNHSSYWHD